MSKKQDDFDMVWKQRVTGDVELPRTSDYVSKKSVPSVVTRRVHTGDVAPSDLSIEVTEYVAPLRRESVITRSRLPYDVTEAETPEEAFLGLIERAALVSGTSHFSRKTLSTEDYFTIAKSNDTGVSVSYDLGAHLKPSIHTVNTLKNLVRNLAKTGAKIELRDCSETAGNGNDYPIMSIDAVLNNDVPVATLSKAMMIVSCDSEGAMVADIKMAESLLNEEFRQQRR